MPSDIEKGSKLPKSGTIYKNNTSRRPKISLNWIISPVCSVKIVPDFFSGYMQICTYSRVSNKQGEANSSP